MSAPSARAELIEDRGEAVVCDQFFRSRPFLDAEGVTHTLRIDAGAAELLAPLIVREIPPPTGRNVEPEATNRPIGPEFDGISPYGYSGLVGGEGVLELAGIDFSATGLVSVFVRHRLGPPPLAGATARIVVQIADPSLAPKSRPSDRRQIRKNLEAGYELALVPGPQTSPAQRAGFLDLYEQTMRRTAAAPHYFFAAAYFDRILEADRTWLALATAPGGDLAAASLAAVSDGFLHYYLSGSADAHLRDSPMKNVLARLVEQAAELGMPLNLGGGLRPGDALEEFKRGFANRSEPWHSSELVCDPAAYARLAAGRDPGGFFPAYRAP